MLKRILNEGLNLDYKEATFENVFDLRRIPLNNKAFYHYDLNLFSAKALFAYLLDYLTPQGYENKESHMKLVAFDRFIDQRKNFVWTFMDDREDKLLTINDVEQLLKEFLREDPDHEDYGVFEKANMRRSQYLYYSSQSISTLILKLIELRDYLYENLSLPLNRNASGKEYEQYLTDSQTTFIYPAHKGLYEP